MLVKHLIIVGVKYPSNIYMSPRNSIARFNASIAKHGAEAIDQPGSFKQEKEMLVTGKLLLGVQKINGTNTTYVLVKISPVTSM
jgi:hypothetical protein